jgi:environmental stress-induced protein Ves
MPWKNGGGETREIAVWPAGAALDALEWRVSLATVASDGPFSTFAGVTRTLCVIQGAGIELHVEDEPARVLQTSSEPCMFDGAAPARAALIDGPIVDLNVMSRRGRFRHRVSRHAFSGSRELLTTGTATFIFCREGSLGCSAATHRGELQAQDCALVEGTPQAVRLNAGRRAEALVIELYREPTSSGS